MYSLRILWKAALTSILYPAAAVRWKPCMSWMQTFQRERKVGAFFFTWSDLFWDRFINRRGQRVFSTNRNARFYLTTKPWKSLKWGFQQDFLSYAWIQMKFKFFKSKLSRKKSDLICDLRINQSDKPKNKTKSMSTNLTFCTTDVRVRRGLNSRGPCSLNACTSLPVKSILLK